MERASRRRSIRVELHLDGVDPRISTKSQFEREGLGTRGVGVGGRGGGGGGGGVIVNNRDLGVFLPRGDQGVERKDAGRVCVVQPPSPPPSPLRVGAALLTGSHSQTADALVAKQSGDL